MAGLRTNRVASAISNTAVGLSCVALVGVECIREVQAARKRDPQRRASFLDGLRTCLEEADQLDLAG